MNTRRLVRDYRGPIGVPAALLISALIGGSAAVYSANRASMSQKAAMRQSEADQQQLLTALQAPKPVMPTPTDQEVQQAQQRATLDAVARRGRASTILTGDTGTQQKLGAA